MKKFTFFFISILMICLSNIVNQSIAQDTVNDAYTLRFATFDDGTVTAYTRLSDGSLNTQVFDIYSANTELNCYNIDFVNNQQDILVSSGEYPTRMISLERETITDLYTPEVSSYSFSFTNFFPLDWLFGSDDNIPICSFSDSIITNTFAIISRSALNNDLYSGLFKFTEEEQRLWVERGIIPTSLQIEPIKLTTYDFQHREQRQYPIIEPFTIMENIVSFRLITLSMSHDASNNQIAGIALAVNQFSVSRNLMNSQDGIEGDFFTPENFETGDVSLSTSLLWLDLELGILSTLWEQPNTFITKLIGRSTNIIIEIQDSESLVQDLNQTTRLLLNVETSIVSEMLYQEENTYTDSTDGRLSIIRKAEDNNLYLVDNQTQSEMSLFIQDDPNADYERFSWSADNQQVAFWETTYRLENRFNIFRSAIRQSNEWTIYSKRLILIDINTMERTIIPQTQSEFEIRSNQPNPLNDSNIIWSPDSSQITFTDNRYESDRNDIYVYSLNDRSFTRVTNDATRYRHLAWSSTPPENTLFNEDFIIGDIQVLDTIDNNVIAVEPRDYPNCEGTRNIDDTRNFTRTEEVNTHLSFGVISGTEFEVGIGITALEIFDVNATQRIMLQIETELGTSTTRILTDSREITLGAGPGSHVRYDISWVVVVRLVQVEIIQDGRTDYVVFELPESIEPVLGEPVQIPCS